MAIFDGWRRRRAVAGYARCLPAQLRRDYGPAPAYSPAQVRASIGRAGLDQTNSCYAMAMYTSPADFAADHAARGESCDYDAMRAEVSDMQFGGADVPAADQLCADAPASDAAPADAGSGGADWSGGDAGGSSDSSPASSGQDV